ncbi:MAG: DUF4347 domain-containing protein [Microcoleus sp. SM1_3_4]|nr:DUF4347 domain-containing protein [Microcoleus sp. SM1_3_4]
MSNSQVSSFRKSIAFIDSQVDDYQTLVAGVKPGTEVVVLDAGRDAIEQITEILGDRTNIDSIHIISHGSPGSLQIGKTGFCEDNLEAYSQQLRQWQSAFTDSAEILIYGCNVASGSRDRPKIRQGFKPPNNLVGAGSPTILNTANRLNKPALTHEQPLNIAASKNIAGSSASGACPTVRRGFKPPSHSESRLKPTGEIFNKHSNKQLNKQSSERDLYYETGNELPGGIGEEARDLDVGFDFDGFTFIQRIAQLTNTNVAASKNLTGSAAKGGNWN